ncbi:MAG: hypothetical protein EOL92_08070 [Bacteroidia bacterium]|nr:hypothetical protein [Bacteroidia bacterium]
MNDEIAEVFSGILDEYVKYIATKQDKQHFTLWVQAHAPVMAARVRDILSKANATQEVDDARTERTADNGQSGNTGTRTAPKRRARSTKSGS